MNKRRAIAMAALAVLGLCPILQGQTYSPFEATGVYARTTIYPPAPPVQAVAPQDPAPLEDWQLDHLLGPIALYPDPLLAQILPAATYDSEIVRAARWQAAYPNMDERQLALLPWEPSVKALLHYPEVLAMMSDNLEWTQAVGAAFLAQQGDVVESIQRLRRQALLSGALQTTNQQQVLVEDGYIQVLPASPQVVYVPTYDPQVVYVRQTIAPARPLITFSIARTVGAWLDNGFDWRRRWIHSGNGWHVGWRFDDHRWRRDDKPVVIIRSPYSRDWNTRPGELRPWAHNNAKPKPILPPVLIGRRSYDDHRGWNDRDGWDRDRRDRDRDDRRVIVPSGPRKPFSLPLPGLRDKVDPRHTPPPPTVRTTPPPTVRTVPPPTVRPSTPSPFGPFQNRDDVRRSLERAEQSRGHLSATPPRTATTPQPARLPAPRATTVTPGPLGQPRSPMPTPLPNDDARRESDRGHRSMRK
ncbi:MAG: hypothetical protein BWX88_00359 [Planctomycetes bacterium ADurb.Bin126]|nr:MAG: hypothetical protein BWX88_00359 [Planctomycetes bacterium ADurb.Bin126]HOD81254.1 DUF3300 domain-containing protein [Phycisphaerae bacterium]HQL71582.1 DUF3300 domain-containing protein [Phycisphaerae bacterium]